MKKTLLLCAVVLALVMMTACKIGNRNSLDTNTTLLSDTSTIKNS